MFRIPMYKKNKKSEGIPKQNKSLLSVFQPARAGLTLEAALVLPLFLFFITAILSFLTLIALQTEIRLSMEETARSLGKKAYFAERSAHLTGEKAEEEEGALSIAINSLSIKTLMLRDGLKEHLDASRVRGGTGGFYVYHSSYDIKQGVLDIVVNYTYVFPFLPEKIGAVRFVQRCRSHVWTGKRLRDSEEVHRDEKEQTVYMTPHGSVYHLSASCPYLDLSVRRVSQSEVETLRNKDRKIYYRCTDCCKKDGTYSAVYITDYGTNWHSDLHCSGLKRAVEEVPLSKAGGKHVCSRCAELYADLLPKEAGEGTE